MAVATFTSYAPGTCASCGQTIRKGDTCAWGPQPKSRVHAQCAGVTAAPAPKPAPMMPNLDPYQQAVVRHVEQNLGNLIVEAVAGSGKTSTIQQAALRIPADTPARYLAFNRKNADEAQERMPAHVEASTFHSVCGKALGKFLRPRGGRFDEHKMQKLWKALIQEGAVTEREADDLGPAVQRLVALAKAEGVACLVPDVIREWDRICATYGIEFTSRQDEESDGFDPAERGVEIARTLLRASNDRLDMYDFDDMLYLCVRLHVPLPQYTRLFVDEAQDTNCIQRALLRTMLAPGGQIVAVGDSRQAIYQFRGATASAMALIGRDFDCQVLPLSVNYRCSQAVIAAAQEFCPQIQACATAPLGSVEDVPAMTVRDFCETDAVLSRVNANLITLWYRLFRAGVPATILGRDIGKGLIALVGKMQGKRTSLSIAELLARLDAYRVREIARWTAKGEDQKAQSVEDKVESLLAAIDSLPEDGRTVENLIAHLEHMFDDKSRGRLTLSTVHKAKGMEWTRVFILDRDRMPSPWARSAHDKEAEDNIIYVAYTRAKVDLRFVKAEAIAA